MRNTQMFEKQIILTAIQRLKHQERWIDRIEKHCPLSTVISKKNESENQSSLNQCNSNTYAKKNFLERFE